MPYNFSADSFHTKKLCLFVADFLGTKCDFFTEIGRLIFLRPLWGT